MAQLIADLATVASNRESIERRIAEARVRTGRGAQVVTLCAATKYVGADGMAVLRDAGIHVAGENRLQDLIAKQDAFAADFEWHFIGAVQSRKVTEIASRVSTIHSLCTESARDRLAAFAGAIPNVFVQVNVSGEATKEGVAPAALGEFLESCPFPVAGLTTMPPAVAEPELARPYFRRLAELAAGHDLPNLSMGTTQDFEVAVEEGATHVRVGSALFTPKST